MSVRVYSIKCFVFRLSNSVLSRSWGGVRATGCIIIGSDIERIWYAIATYYVASCEVNLELVQTFEKIVHDNKPRNLYLACSSRWKY